MSQRVAAFLLTLLMVVPGAGLAALPVLAPPLLPEVLPPAAQVLADKAFVGSFDQLDAFEGAGDLASLQPTLESVLRVYAQDRGFALSPPVTPSAGAEHALGPALQALALATGKPVSAGQLQQADALPGELQQALARIVLAYLQAAKDYAAATAGLTFADLARVAAGQAPTVQPDAGRMASAALLLDRAVRESAPALRKWGLLLELEERTQHPRLADFDAAELLRAGAGAQSLRDAADLAALMHGFLPSRQAYQPQAQSASGAWLGLYQAMGLPVLPSDQAGFALLDQLGPAHQALALVAADSLLQAAGQAAKAELLVSPAELDAAYAALEAMDLDAVRAADPETLDLAPLQEVVAVLQRADQALLARLQGAALLSDAMDLAGDIAPFVGQPGLDDHKPFTFPTIPIPIPGAECTLAESPPPSEELYLHCPGNPVNENTTLLNVKWFVDENALSLVVFADEDGNGQPVENEIVLRTPALADASNDILLKDPYGFILVGGNGHTVYDDRYGNVNLSLRMENGTWRAERRTLYEGTTGSQVQQAFNGLGGVIGQDVNDTLFRSQAEGVLNLTLNPHNATLLSLDLGGDDLYNRQPGGSSEVLRVWNSSFEEKYGRSLPGFFFPFFVQCQGGNPTTTFIILGQSTVDCGNGEIRNAVVIGGFNWNDPGGSGHTQVNLSNLSLPLRLGVAIDLSGDDIYDTPFNHSLGASDRGLGILWDRERCAPDASAAESSGCAGFKQGHDQYLGAAFTQGSGFNRGVGLFLDEKGDDVHVARNHSLGDGANRGLGLALDLAGNDRWYGENYTLGTGGREKFREHPYCTQGSCPVNSVNNSGFAQEWGNRTGLGLLLERGGNDVYDQRNATSAQGKGWPALGLLLDLGGADRGLQLNVTTTGPFGTVALGFQENNFLAWGTNTQSQFDYIAAQGRGGGLVVDAELFDPSGMALNPSRGVGLGAVEVQGETNSVACPISTSNPVLVALFGPSNAPTSGTGGSRRCMPLEDQSELDYKVLSHQKVLLRIPGAFALGGALSNDGIEAPANDEEHLLQFDLGGNDVYVGPHAGAAVPNLTRLDMDGQAAQEGPPPIPEQQVNMAPLLQGGLIAPVSLLVDATGSDLYDGRSGMLGGQRRNLTTPSLGGAWMGIGLLADVGLAPGATPLRVVPAACPAGRDDVYLGFNRTLGYGALYGIGALVDAAGDDCYVALTGDSGANATNLAYAQGVGRLGGVGVLLDARGSDAYAAGNFSQGAGVLEPTHDHLPRRVTNPVSGQGLQFHDEAAPQSQSAYARTPPHSLGALVDARGSDRYAFGHSSQGWGETRRNQSDATINPALGLRKTIAGLFVDDGFENDTYLNASWAPAQGLRPVDPVTLRPRDNSFWCSQPNLGALNPGLDAAQDLPRLGNQSVQNPLLNATQASLDRASKTASQGPNAAATCLRLEVDSIAKAVDLGTLGRGFDNLDFFANFLLAAGTFGEEFVRARSVLTAPAVVGVGCTRDFTLNNEGTGFAQPGGPCDGLNQTQRVQAEVLWGPASFLYNTYQLLRHVCAQATGDDAACLALLFEAGSGQRLRDVCASVLTAPPDPTLTCANLIRDAYNLDVGSVSLRLNATAEAVEFATGSAGANALFADALRRVTFTLRPSGTDEDILLGHLDRREGASCNLNFTGPCAGNVSRLDTNGRLSLRWDTTQLIADADGLPRLRTPDGRYNLVVAAHFQPDALSGDAGARLDPAEQRYVLNRLGDEYGFYPGVTSLNATIDNAPLVYQLQYRDISLAGDDEFGRPNHELRLNLTASPRVDHEGTAFGPPYEVRASLVPLEEGRLGLAARTFACPAVPSAPFSFTASLEAVTCAPLPPNATGRGEARREGIVAGWTEAQVREVLQDGAFALRVDVTEPAHAGFPARGTVACFVRHGLELAPVEQRLANGTADAGAPASQLRDLDQEWTQDAWQGQLLRLAAGTGAGQARRITGNTLTHLLLDAALVPAPDASTRYDIVDTTCASPLAVDSVRPVTLAVFDPVRTGADGIRYVNRSVAYPGPLGIANRTEALVPLRFDTVNAAEKRSPVLEFRVHTRVTELGVAADDFAGIAEVRAGSRDFTGLPRGNVTIPVCENNEVRGAMGFPCVFPRDFDRNLVFNESDSRFLVEVQVSAVDLAGNVDAIAFADDGGPQAEDAGIVDLDPPEAKTCQPQGTGKTGVSPSVPRVRTRDRLIPMPWDPGLEGCQGAVAPRDNQGVEAVLIHYGVVAPEAPSEVANLDQSWEPPAAQQQASLARFDFDERGVNATLVNNKTLQFMAVARDFAGNVQDRLLSPWRVTYDTRPPDVEVLNLTADHGSITYRWYAQDAEAPPARVARSYVAWGTVNASTGAPELDRTTEAAFGGSQARAVLGGLLQNTTYYLRAVSLDDVGNVATLPLQQVHTDPIARIDILTPQPGDVLVGSVPLKFNVSDVRGDPVLQYNITLVIPTANGTLVVPVENLTRRECITGEAECPTVLDATTVTRTLASARFPDAREAYLRLAVNNSLNPGHPYVVSVGPLKVDNSPPLTRLEIVAQGGPVWWRTAALLLLQPLDNITDVAHTEYSFDNFTFLPYNASAPPVQDREGTIPFFFRSVDAVGNVEELRVVDINVDKQRPSGNVTINGGARATGDANVTLTLEARDGLSGLANVTLDAGGPSEVLERPARFAVPRSFPVTLAGGEGERRVRVRLVDLAGNVQELKASILVDTTAPTISSLHVDSVGHTRAALAWRTSEPSITRIEYGPAGADVLPNRFQAEALGLGHNVALQSLRPSLSYAYRVVAEDALGNRATARGTFETLPDVTPPGAPHSLKAEDLGNGAVRLSWEAAFDDVGIDHYVVLRGVAGQLDELGRAGELVFLDDRGLAGVTYDYAVQAVDLAGQPGPLSIVAQGRATTKPVLSDGSVTPDKGVATTIYTYSVVVRDADGDAPSSVRVRLNGQARELRPQFEGRADFAQGVLYTLETRLPGTTLSGGFPTYQFEATDGRGGVVQWPDVPLAGPAVLGAGALLPGLSAASSLFGLPGFEVLLAAVAVGVALVVLHVRRRGAP